MTAIDKRQQLSDLKDLIRSEDFQAAVQHLAGLSDPWDGFALQAQYAKLLARLPQAFRAGTEIRIAVMGDSTTDHFVDVLGFWLALAGFDAEIYQTEFDTIDQSILDPSSGLIEFAPDIAWFLTSWRGLHLNTAPGTGPETLDGQIEDAVSATIGRWRALRDRHSCQIIQNNADIPAEDPFGNYAGTAPESARSLLHEYNRVLARRLDPGVILFDLDHLSSSYGKRRWCDQRYWYHSKHAFALDALGPIAFQGASLISALKGRAKKCVVLDLDNTLWGGVVGDDGIDGIRLGDGPDGEAFVDFQRYLLGLKGRGILLAVCSKNEEAIAKEAFESHPDMQLTLDDIVVFRANWDNKADNIRNIADTLNIGLDALVFVDDNPAERDLVRQFLPMVAVPDLPEDPAEFTAALSSHCYFETTFLSSDDLQRSAYYKGNAAREDVKTQYRDLSEFQRGLEMVAETGPFDSFHLPRVAQLINKSNQFHLTGTRYTEAEIQSMMGDDQIRCLYFTLADRFGDNGLISAVIAKCEDDGVLGIDTWVMSCRVLGRSMEELIRNVIVDIACESGCREIVGRYRPSKKNKLVENLYSRLGFDNVGDNGGETVWSLRTDPKPEPLATQIQYRATP